MATASEWRNPTRRSTGMGPGATYCRRRRFRGPLRTTIFSLLARELPGGTLRGTFSPISPIIWAARGRSRRSPPGGAPLRRVPHVRPERANVGWFSFVPTVGLSYRRSAPASLRFGVLLLNPRNQSRPAARPCLNKTGNCSTPNPWGPGPAAESPDFDACTRASRAFWPGCRR
jgi:hypothetical protein